MERVFWRLLLGAFYRIGGAVQFADPLVASIVLMLAFAAALIAFGPVRIFLALQQSSVK